MILRFPACLVSRKKGGIVVENVEQFQHLLIADFSTLTEL